MPTPQQQQFFMFEDQGSFSMSMLNPWASYDAFLLGTLFKDNLFTDPTLVNNDAVGGWKDVSGHGFHLAQATVANRLVYNTSGINGRPTVTCAVSGSKSLAAAFGSTLAQPVTMIVAIKYDTSADNLYMFDGVDVTNREVLFRSSSKWTWFAGSSVAGPTTDTNPHIHIFNFAGASSKYYVDGGAPNTGNPGTNGIAGLTVFNRYTSDSGQAGKIGEFHIVPRTLSLDEVNRAGSFLGAKWGITWNQAT